MAKVKVAHSGLRIAEHTGAEPPATQALWRAALAGKFPAEFRSNAWWIDEADLPLVAAAFGIPWKKAKPAADQTPVVA